MDVRLLEQGEQLGGRCQSVQMGPDKAYRFDTGPSLLLFPQTYRQTYLALGTRMEGALHISTGHMYYTLHACIQAPVHEPCMKI